LIDTKSEHQSVRKKYADRATYAGMLHSEHHNKIKIYGVTAAWRQEELNR